MEWSLGSAVLDSGHQGLKWSIHCHSHQCPRWAAPVLLWWPSRSFSFSSFSTVKWIGLGLGVENFHPLSGLQVYVLYLLWEGLTCYSFTSPSCMLASPAGLQSHKAWPLHAGWQPPKAVFGSFLPSFDLFLSVVEHRWILFLCSQFHLSVLLLSAMWSKSRDF